MSLPTQQTVNINAPIPVPAGKVPVSDGAGGFTPVTLPAAAPSFASNYAQGPSVDQAIGGGGSFINYSTVSVGSAPSNSIRVTPSTTGRIRVIAMVTLTNSALGAATGVQVQLSSRTGILAPVTIGTTDVVVPVTMGGFNGAVCVPVVFDFTVSIGIATTISIFVNPLGATNVTASQQRCTLDIQELPAATG